MARAKDGRKTDKAMGVAAVTAIGLLAAGTPAALIAAFGLPLPHTLPTVSSLTRPLGAAAMLHICAGVVWLAWLQLMWCLAVETVAAARNSGMPRPVPFAGATQAIARRLVTAALLLSPAAVVAPAVALPMATASAGATPSATGPAGAGLAASGHWAAGSEAVAARDGERGLLARPVGAASARAEPVGGGDGLARPAGAEPAQAPSASVRAGQVGSAPPPRPACQPTVARPGGLASDVGGGTANVARPRADFDAASLLTRTAPMTPSRQARGTEKIYVVRPPEGRFHESLWEIAQRFLGDGRRYREIFELNAGRPQPDGATLTIASLIRPGWVLRLPADAQGPGIEAAPVPGVGLGRADPDSDSGADARPRTAGHAASHPASAHAEPQPAGSAQLPAAARPAAPAERPPAPAARPSAQGPSAPAARPSAPADRPAVPLERPSGRPRTSEPLERPRGAARTRVPIQRPSRPIRKSAQAEPPATGRESEPAHAQRVPGRLARATPARPPAPAARSADQTATYPFELAATGMLAAGVLAVLARRRREQWRQRVPGRRLNGPGPAAALTESGLRERAQEVGARSLKNGLRRLAEALAGQGRALPVVLAAHLGEDTADLWIRPADRQAPAPWSAVEDGQVWRMALPAVAWPDPVGTDPDLAPYPGLVAVGSDGAGQVLVDVAATPGVIAISGPDGLVQAALAAVAAELSTSILAGRMRLTLAGFGADLAVLAPDRVRAARSLAEAVDTLEGEDPAVGDGPRVLVAVGVPPEPGWDRLLALAGPGRRLTALVAGEAPGAVAVWEVTADGRLLIPDLGLDLAANLLLPSHQAEMAGLFQAPGQPEGVEMGPFRADPVPPAQLEPDSSAPVEVALLGAASVRAPGEIAPDDVALATEIVAYMALHPGGVHPNVLAKAIWPRGVSREARESALSRVRDWLCADGIGRLHLAADAGGRLRLGSQVRVDWRVFSWLVSGAGPEDERERLDRALGLVRGPFADRRPPGRYSWLADGGLEFEVAARVADAAHRLCELRLADGRPDQAVAAARAGLRLARDDEVLWRDLLTAARHTGEEALLRAVVAELRGKAARDGMLPRLAPQTEALINELPPAGRTPAK